MFFGGFLGDSASSQNLFGHPDVERCPFLRNMNGATTLSFTSALPVAVRYASYAFFQFMIKVASVSLTHNTCDCAGPSRQGSNF